jgi:predicted RNA-binding protein Jag
MFQWRLVCLLAAGFAVAASLVQADQRAIQAGLLVLAADAQTDAKADPKADAKPEAKPDAKSDTKAAAKADPKTDAKTVAKTDAKVDAKADAKSKAKTSSQTINERVSMWLKTCLQDWDTATHMSKEQWRTTCERVSKERGKFLNETPETLALPSKR